MKEIDIEDYFIEIIDEGRSTIGYDCIPYKTKELVHKIYKQNDELKRLEQENEKLKELIEEYKNRYCEVYENADKLSRKYYQYKQALEEIREIVSEPCVAGENCITCNSNCTNKDILNKIDEVLK